MKRYMPTIKIVGFEGAILAAMKKFEGGDYLRYKDVRNLIESILDDCSLWETKPELLIKEWGEE